MTGPATGRDELLERLVSVTREIVTGLPEHALLGQALAVSATIQLVTDFEPLAVYVGVITPGPAGAQGFRSELPPAIAPRYAEATSQFFASGLNSMPEQDQPAIRAAQDGGARFRLVTELSTERGVVFRSCMEQHGQYVELFRAELSPESEN